MFLTLTIKLINWLFPVQPTPAPVYKDAVRLRNFHRSVAAEQLGYAPKAKWIATESAVEGREEESNVNRAEIVPTGNGRFALVRRGYGTLNTYARARDARRGATRLGLIVA